MNELLSDDLWVTIKRLAKKSSVKRAAVAYITTEEFVKFGEGDILITDASDHAIASGHTNARILARAHRRGAQLFSLSGLHSKVLLLEGTAVIGSANLSESSANSLVEAAWVTDAPATVGMATSLIQQLAAQAEPINDGFLRRIVKIDVHRNWRPGKTGKKPIKVKIPKHRTWIIGVHEMVRDFEDEQNAIDSGEAIAKQKITQETSEVAWIRWTGKSRFRAEAKTGDTVIQIWSDRRLKTPKTVYRHTSILHRQQEKTCTRFFVEDFDDCDATSLTWSNFRKLITRLGVPGKLGPSSARPISEAFANALFSLWGQ